MNRKAFIFHIEENEEILTPENLLFALEGCYPQIKITELYETEIIDDNSFENQLNNDIDKFNEAMQNFKEQFKKSLKKKKSR